MREGDIESAVENMVAKHFESLDANARDLFVAAMRWMESNWDESAGLLWDAGDAKLVTRHHTIRGSVWYAFGLLMRNRAGDSARAVRVIDTVLNYQFDAPGHLFHGTFWRAPEEPSPPADAVIWRDYDPNWREFIVTALALVLSAYAEQLPGALVEKIDAAIRRAVAGARARGLSASYTNIALMYAFMLCFAGKRFDEPTWFAEGECMAREVYRLFKQHDAFAEYNSPTYYGVDVYALALWRSYPALSPLLARLGAEIEALIWRDVAQFYHANLRNLAGPYDRSYGMDMRRYVAVIGIWMRLVMDKTHAPFPDTDRPFEHEHDIGFVPLIAFLGARVPPDALADFVAFRGERQIERVISDSPRRVATAWLGQDRMLGGEFTSRTPPHSNQLHPATIHWRMDAEEIGWARMLYREPVDARASKNRLEIETTSEIVFHVHAPGARIEHIELNAWTLPQLSVRVEGNAERMDVQPHASLFEIRYAVAPGQPITCVLKWGDEMKDTGTAAQQYAARVDAVLAQRTRLRGPQPPGDLFAGLPADSPLLKSNPHRPLDANLEIIASYIEADDVIIDVGGGAGRISLPLALRCREVINVEPSRAMGAGFRANATQAGIENVRIVAGDWLSVDPPVGSVALVNHVTYLTREIAPFIEKLERAGPRRVLITVSSPPPPSWNRVLYQLVHRESEEVVPGHVELVNVLWELGILPDVRVLPLAPPGPTIAPTREAAIAGAVEGLVDQWTLWPLGAELEQRLRRLLEARFDELFAVVPDGFVRRWIPPGHEILITWQPNMGN